MVVEAVMPRPGPAMTPPQRVVIVLLILSLLLQSLLQQPMND